MRRFVYVFISSWLLAFATVGNVDSASRAIGVQGKRLALVIGNGAYDTAPLRNPVHDAQDMARTLKGLGFDVLYEENASQKAMEDVIREFGRRLRSGGVGLFYFAGHAVQVNGRNYLIPVNAVIESESDVRYEAIDAGRVLGKMEDAANELNIVILDACRDNPFARSFRSASRGLARMDAPTGSILAYATAPGTVAHDGPDRNGLYTSMLLAHITAPGLSLESLFKRVRVDVMNVTHANQVPWESTSLTGTFYFVPPIKGDTFQASSSPTPTIAPQLAYTPKKEFYQSVEGGYEIGIVTQIYKEWCLVVVDLNQPTELHRDDSLLTVDENGQRLKMRVGRILKNSVSAITSKETIERVTIKSKVYRTYP